MTSAAVWLLLRLRLLVLPAWILLAVVVTLQLPAFTNQSESDVGGMIATGSESVRVEERGVREFGTPLLSRVAVVQRDPKGLSTAAQKRTLALALLAAPAAEVANPEVRFGLARGKRDRSVPCVERGVGLRSLKRKPEDDPRFCIGSIALDRGSCVARGLLEVALRETGARDLAERFGTSRAQRAVAVLVALAAAARTRIVAADIPIWHSARREL